MNNGTEKNISAKNAFKAVVGSQAAGAGKTVVGAAGDAAATKICDSQIVCQ